MIRKIVYILGFTFFSGIVFANETRNPSQTEEIKERGLSLDHESVVRLCGVGAYVFRTPQECTSAAPVATVKDETVTTAAAAEPAPATIPEVISFDNHQALYFDTNKKAILGEQQSNLRKTIAYLRAHPNSSVQISGYADATGQYAHNVGLARARAESLKNFLLTENITKDRIQIVQSPRPVSRVRDNQEDRRVDLSIETLAE